MALEKEFKFYQDNKEKFLVEYEGKFIVIKGNEVIGVFKDRLEAIEKTKQKHELGTFLVQEVVKDDVLVFHSRVLVGQNAG